MNNLLSIDSVSKHYGNFTALNNVSLNVKEGSIFGLLGPNGAGKTTLIRIINQITRPDEGKILFNNEPLNINHIRDIGYLPEERGLYPKMNIGDQAVYLAQLKGLQRDAAKSELFDEVQEIQRLMVEGGAKRNHERVGKCQNCSRKYACDESLA